MKVIKISEVDLVKLLRKGKSEREFQIYEEEMINGKINQNHSHSEFMSIEIEEG